MTVALAAVAPGTLALPAAGVTLFGEGEVPFSQAALRQTELMSELPGVVHAIGLPDLHASQSVPNGLVVATDEMLIPAAVGRDVNCGMRLMTTNLHRDDIDRDALERVAEEINLGYRWGPLRLAPGDVEIILAGGVSSLGDISHQTRAAHPVWDLLTAGSLAVEKDRIEERGSLKGDPSAVARSHQRIGLTQLGTLGSGNHFIEFQVVAEVLDAVAAETLGIFQGGVALMIHSGSRGLGHNVATQFMQRARAEARHAPTPLREVFAVPADGPTGRDYQAAHHAASNYASANRLLLGALTLHALRGLFPEVSFAPVCDISHNSVRRETYGNETYFVHRKGAARALPGQPVIIPGSMGTASYLVIGAEGSAASLHSVNHGAGRILPRSAATGQHRREVRRECGDFEQWRAGISAREFRRQMRGIELVYSDGGRLKGVGDVNRDGLPIIGEAPGVYKDIEDVIGVVARRGLAHPVARMRPIGVIKEG